MQRLLSPRIAGHAAIRQCLSTACALQFLSSVITKLGDEDLPLAEDFTLYVFSAPPTAPSHALWDVRNLIVYYQSAH